MRRSITFMPKVGNIVENALRNGKLWFENEFERDNHLMGREEI